MSYKTKLTFGKKAQWNSWGLLGCSHGMYSGGGYNNWVYGIKYLFNLQILEQWGCYDK